MIYFRLLSLLFYLQVTGVCLKAQVTQNRDKWKRWGDQGNGTYVNPVLPADYSDLDAIRVGDDYDAISSTIQFSPGIVSERSQRMKYKVSRVEVCFLS